MDSPGKRSTRRPSAGPGDYYDFDRPMNNMVAATSEGASWGFFDFRRKGEGFDDGYQSVPVNWGISSARTRRSFTLVREMTDAR